MTEVEKLRIELKKKIAILFYELYNDVYVFEELKIEGK